MNAAPRLIISDIDGTFITSAGRVTGRLRAVICLLYTSPSPRDS